MHSRGFVCGRMVLFLCLLLTACDKQTDAEEGTEDVMRMQTKMQSEMIEYVDSTRSEKEDEEEDNIIIVHTTEGIKYSDEEMPVLYTDDWSPLDQMEQTDCNYVCRDDKVYYRQYHKDSFEEGAVFSNYQAIAGTKKEIVCMDADGKKTVLFSDQGYGNFYLVGDRFYMTEKVIKVQGDVEYDSPHIYSVDMQGQNREDYGDGEICVVDTDRNLLVLKIFSEVTGEGAFCVLNCISGEKTVLTYDPGGIMTLWDYHDGWCYFDEHIDDDICRVVAISVEGMQKSVIALAADQASEGHGYREDICNLSVDDDRIYIVFGGYAGSGGYFQGGRIITAKLDGSDYRAVECCADCYFVCYEDGSPRLYFLDYFFESGEEGKTKVWDVEKNTVSMSDFLPEMIYGQWTQNALVHSGTDSNLLCELHGNIYALSGDLAEIVRIADRIDRKVEQRGDLEWNWDYHRGDVSYMHLYYADGYLYFDAVFNRYDEEYTVGWREGYRRVQTNVYRLKLADGTMELLYSY